VEGVGERLVLYKAKRRLAPEEFPAFLEKAIMISDLLVVE
jgi:hypothetical protein